MRYTPRATRSNFPRCVSRARTELRSDEFPCPTVVRLTMLASGWPTIMELSNVAGVTPPGAEPYSTEGTIANRLTLTRHHAASLVARRGQSGITFDLLLTRA